jgi:hypothetical protein
MTLSHYNGAIKEKKTMQRRSFMTIAGAALVGWAGKGALPAAAQENGASVPPAPAGQPTDATAKREALRSHEKWLRDVAFELTKIQVGMTRGDLEKKCVGGGGYHSRRRQVYLYRDCHTIRLDVHFKPASEERDTDGRDVGGQSPTDIITEISQPFIDPFFSGA